MAAPNRAQRRHPGNGRRPINPADPRVFCPELGDRPDGKTWYFLFDVWATMQLEDETGKPSSHFGPAARDSLTTRESLAFFRWGLQDCNENYARPDSGEEAAVEPLSDHTIAKMLHPQNAIAVTMKAYDAWVAAVPDDLKAKMDEANKAAQMVTHEHPPVDPEPGKFPGKEPEAPAMSHTHAGVTEDHVHPGYLPTTTALNVEQSAPSEAATDETSPAAAEEDAEAAADPLEATPASVSGASPDTLD